MKDDLCGLLLQHSAAIVAQLRELYGDSLGVDLYETAGFAVHPDYQGCGIGTAVHRHIADQAKKDGKIWFFTSLNHHVRSLPSVSMPSIAEFRHRRWAFTSGLGARS